MKLVKINIDKNQMLAQQLRIQSIPAVYAFFGGRPVDGFMGAVPESQVQRVRRSPGAIGGGAAGDGADDLDAALEHAKQAVAESDFRLAAQIYNRCWRWRRTTCRRMAGLARCYAQEGQVEQAKAILARWRPRTKAMPRSSPCRRSSTSPSRPRPPVRSAS